jgi:uncharacterized membrane protein YccC
MPAVFAFADRVIQDPDTTLFAAFGSFAVLVLADFGGPWRTRLAAYLALAATGVVLIALGTLCSQTPWLAVAAMAVVGFAILFSAVISGYFAAGGFAALLLFIIPVAFPGPASAVPARLEGWLLAASVGICAKMLLWPARRRDVIGAGAARACSALADLMDTELSRDRSAIADRAGAATAAVAEVRRSFVATPYRPTGPTGGTEALAFLVDELDWLLSVASAAPGRVESELDPCRAENREVMAAAVAVLRASAANLESGHRSPDLARLDRARDAAAGALAGRIEDRAGTPGTVPPLEAPQPSFRMRAISFSVRDIGINALLAAGAAAPDPGPPDAPGDRPSRRERAAARGRSAAAATGKLLLEHASGRSASFRNSVRGAAALTVAVLVIELASVQNAFWVVLATLSVLRSNALGTGATIFSALSGTVAGIVVGGVLVYAIGTDEGVLWAVLPPAVLLAAYAPRAISFAAGQAGFTVVVLIIFNIIVPTGWTLGLVRVEDVAIGCAISLAVGVLFWPRGAETLVRETLGAAYASAAYYVEAAARRLAGSGPPMEAAVGSRRTAARAAAHRLDDVFRQYLSEPSARRANLDSLAALVTGATRLRLAAYSLSTLARAPKEPPFDRCVEALASEARSIRAWYGVFADGIVGRAQLPAPQLRDGEGRGPVLRCVGEVIAGQQAAGRGPPLSLLWASQHLDGLWRLGAELVDPAMEFTGPASAPRGGSARSPKLTTGVRVG